MQTRLSIALVTSVASALQAAAHSAGGNLERAAAMDQASQSLVGQNWAAVSATLDKRQAMQSNRLCYHTALPAGTSLELAKPIRLLVEMSTDNPAGGCPNHVVFTLDQSKLDAILAAREQLLDNHYRSVDLDLYDIDGMRQNIHFRALPESDLDGYFNLQDGVLRVLETSFRFRASPKHTTYDCTSAHVDLRELREVLANQEVGHSKGQMIWIKPDVLLVQKSLDGFHIQDFVEQLVTDAESYEGEDDELVTNLVPDALDVEAITNYTI